MPIDKSLQQEYDDNVISFPFKKTFKEEIEALLKAREVARKQVSQNQLALISLDESIRPPARRRGRRLKVPSPSKILDIEVARRQQGA